MPLCLLSNILADISGDHSTGSTLHGVEKPPDTGNEGCIPLDGPSRHRAASYLLLDSTRRTVFPKPSETACAMMVVTLKDVADLLKGHGGAMKGTNVATSPLCSVS